MTDAGPRRLSLIGPASPYRGGIAQFTDMMTSGLRSRGEDVQVVTFSRQYPKLFFPGKSQFEPTGGHVQSDDRALVDSVNPVSWVRAARQIVRHDPKAAIFQYWLPYFAPAYATMSGRLRKHSVKVLSVVHNVVPHERRMGDVRLGRQFLDKCEGFVALSDAVADDLRALGVDAPIETVAHPVYQHFGEVGSRDEARTRLDLPLDAEVLLFFGFIRKYKGLRTLLDAMPEILERRPRARLVIAGEFYDDEKPYMDIIQGHDLNGKVVLHPHYIPAEEVADYFSAANLVVQPYESATQSGVVQTSYNFDRPVVVTDVGGLSEVVPDGRSGFVVPPQDPASLARAVARYFEEDLEDEFTEGVRQEKQRYTWAHLLDVVEEMVG